MTAPRPYNLIAELTYRCPLRCVYCSNPLEFASVSDGLDADAWSRLFAEAASLGVVHVGLTGGEPSARRDLDRIVAGASRAGLYSHLVTAGMPIDAPGLGELAGLGLRSVQLSFQDSRPEPAERIAGQASFETKLAFAAAVRRLGLPLTLNFVIHRHNLERLDEMISLGRRLDAHRIELANVQLHGFALANRAALLPSRAALDRAAALVARERACRPAPEILFVLPDYHRDRPKPCMGGWGRRMIVVDPSGRVLPCQSAAALPGLEFWRYPERSLADGWASAPGMQAFRDPRRLAEPCRSCPEREHDLGGCRCQAFALTGDPAATDPACALAPAHDRVLAARAESEQPAPAMLHRGSGRIFQSALGRWDPDAPEPVPNPPANR